MSRPRLLALLLGANALALLPVLALGFPHGHDSYLHVMWLHHFQTQFLGGELYPRWLTEMGAGLGSPTFYFYPPLPYWVTSLTGLVLDSRTQAHYMLALGTWFAFSVGSVGFHLAARPYLGARARLVGALLYSVIPYHLLVDVYFRGSYAEIFGLAVLPFLFIGADHLPGRRVAQFLVTLCASTLMVFAHPLVAIVALPPSSLWLMFVAWRRSGSVARALWAPAAGIVGVLLSALYIVPALMIENPAESGWELYVIGDYFLYGKPIGGTRLASVAAYASITLSALLACAGLALAAWLAPDRRAHALALLALAAIATFMMTPPSDFLYELLPPLREIQFPWRYTTVLTLLAAFGLAWVHDAPERLPGALARLARPTVVLAGVAFTAATWVAGVLPRSNEPFSERLARDLIEASVDAPEYQLSSLSSGGASRVPRVSGPGAEDVTVEDWSADAIRLSGEFAPGERYALGRQWFGEWRDEAGDTVRASESATHTLELEVLAPTTTISLTRPPFPEEVLGRRLSLVGLALAVLCTLRLALARRRADRGRAAELVVPGAGGTTA